MKQSSDTSNNSALILAFLTVMLWSTGFVFTLCFAGYNLIQRSAVTRYTPLQSTVYTIVASAIMFLIFLPQAIEKVRTAPSQSLLAVLFMGIYPSAIGFLIWTKALSIAKQIGDVTNFMFVTPLLSTFLEIVLIGDIPDAGTFTGGLMILLGVVLFNNRVKLGIRMQPNMGKRRI